MNVPTTIVPARCRACEGFTSERGTGDKIGRRGRGEDSRLEGSVNGTLGTFATGSSLVADMVWVNIRNEGSAPRIPLARILADPAAATNLTIDHA